jgi:hypothetical protein
MVVALDHSLQEPDLNPLVFFVLEHLKERVYRDRPSDMEVLVTELYAAVVTTNADILRLVQASIPRRAVACP